MKNIDQQRATQALKYIKKVPSEEQDDYGSLAKSLPMMLQTNGLAQTLAFLKSKSPDSIAHQMVVRHLSNWLNSILRNDEEEPGDFLLWIVEEPSATYRRACSEAIEFSIWLRRFVEAQGWD